MSRPSGSRDLFCGLRSQYHTPSSPKTHQPVLSLNDAELSYSRCFARKCSMAEKNQAPAAGTASFGGRASRLIPIGLLCTLALAVVVNQIRGKQDQSLDGVVVMDSPRYTFYVGQKDCYPQGAPYLLMPSQNFHDVAATP